MEITAVESHSMAKSHNPSQVYLKYVERSDSEFGSVLVCFLFLFCYINSIAIIIVSIFGRETDLLRV